MLYALDTTAITGLPAPTPPSGVDQVNLPSFSGADLWSAVKSCLRPSSAITTLGLGACLRPMLGRDLEPSSNSSALVGDQDDVPATIIRMIAPAIVRSPAKKTQVLILPLAPLRPKAWTATFLDPEDAPSDDTDDSGSDSDSGSDVATNLWSKSSAHSSTTSLGDDLEFAPLNLIVKKPIPASRGLTVESVSLLDVANVHGTVDNKERSIISWISTDSSSLSEAPPRISNFVDTEDIQPAAPNDVIDARSSLVDTRTDQVAETVLNIDDDDEEDGGDDEWDEWDQLMAEVAVDAGISHSDDSAAVLQESTSSRTFTTTRATDISAAFDVTSVWEDFEIAFKPSSATFVLTMVAPSASDSGVGVIDSNVGCSGDLIEVNEEVSKSTDEEAWGRLESAGLSAPIVSDEEHVDGSDVFRACKVSVADHPTVTTNTLTALRVSTSYDMLESRLKEAQENKKINTFMREVALNEDEDEGEVECILFEEDVVVSYEEPIAELAPKVADGDEEDKYAVEEMLMDDAFAVEDSNTIELPIPGPAMVSPFAGKAGKSCNEESEEDGDRALHHSFDTHSTYAPHQVNKDSYVVATKTNLATRIANTLLYFEYLAIITIFELLSHVFLTTFTLALRVVPSLSTSVVIMRSMVQIIVFLVFVLWFLMLVDPGSPGAQYGGRRGYLVAT